MPFIKRYDTLASELLIEPTIKYECCKKKQISCSENENNNNNKTKQDIKLDTNELAKLIIFS